MKKIFKILLYSLIAVIGFIFTFYLFVPKYIILDYLLSQKGIFLVPESVHERWDKIDLKKVSVYVMNEKEAYFDKLVAKVDVDAIRIIGECKGGYMALEIRPFRYNIKSDKFGCLSRFSKVEGNVNIEGEEIRGKVLLEGFKIQGRNVEYIDISLNGDKVNAVMKIDGFDLKGSGRFKFNPDDPMSSRINLRIEGIIKATISGTVREPSVSLQ